VSGGHAHGLYVHSHSSVHRMPPQCKVVATLAFVVAVVATPRAAFWAFASYVLLLLIVARLARVPVASVTRRLVVELPFLLFAAFLPFLGGGDRVDVLGISMSIEGLWSSWNIVVKATLGALTTVLLAATTPVAEILHGLQRLRVPRAFVATAHFMVRYGDVITGEMRRMKVARESRGYEARWIWQARAVGASLGSLFIRSYERGERVYLAMLSRGYSGALPVIDPAVPGPRDWALALSLPGLGAAVATTAWIVGA
jgi:cobalt/nickel transport system permease protein